jgi:hypothetical protein
MLAFVAIEITSSAGPRKRRLRTPSPQGAVARASAAAVRGIAVPMNAGDDVSPSESVHPPSSPSLMGVRRLRALAAARLRIERVGTETLVARLATSCEPA